MTCALTQPQPAVRHRHAGHPGFTLLEVLVVLIVLGLVLATLSQGVRLGLRAKVAEAGVEIRTGEMEATVRTLRTLFARAMPGDPGAPEPVFIGTAHAVTFVTRLPEGSGDWRESDVTLSVGGGRRLELLRRPHYRRWIVTPPAPASSTVLEGVERLDLDFWQSGPDSSGGGWVSGWQGANLPRLVRLRIVFAPGDRRHWPDIIIAPVRSMLKP